MQLFVRCGAPVGTVALEASPDTIVADLKNALADREAALGAPCCMRLLYAGRQLSAEDTVSNIPGLSPSATLSLTYRLRGAGGDGGSTGSESRSCYLEMYAGKKNDKVNPIEEALGKWTRCVLSGETLAAPVVVDEMGNLFSKEALVHALLHKTLPPQLAYISSLKHVTELKLERNIAHSSSGAATQQGGVGPSNEAAFCCPISGAGFNGRYKFVAFKTGLVVSEKAVKEARPVVVELFGGEWGPDDVTQINPPQEVREVLLDRVMARIASERLARANKKAAKKADKKASATDDCAGPSSSVDAEPAGGARAASGAGASAGAVAPAASGAAAAGQLPGLTGVGKRPPSGAPAATAAAPASAAASSDWMAPAAAAPGAGRALGPTVKKAKTMAVMPKGADPKLYASMFTSSQSESVNETYSCRSTSARGMNLT
ncbi:hypothetical protein FOA52_004460 [Chlamydomonas sp. UWO 241]|nr:hypothetical protein FOA52_004460 [Chlamydomonas sp. UWO 241]